MLALKSRVIRTQAKRAGSLRGWERQGTDSLQRLWTECGLGNSVFRLLACRMVSKQTSVVSNHRTFVVVFFFFFLNKIHRKLVYHLRVYMVSFACNVFL